MFSRATSARRSAAALDEGDGADHLEGPFDLIKRVAMVSHDSTGLGDVIELGGLLQRRELSLGTL